MFLLNSNSIGNLLSMISTFTTTT